MGEQGSNRQTHIDGTTGHDHARRVLVPIALVKGLAGAASVWAWVLASLLLAGHVGAAPAGGAGAAAIRAGVLLGMAAMPVVFLLLRKVAHRGPELGRRSMVAVACAASAAVLLEALAADSTGLPAGGPWGAAAAAIPWFFSGVLAAYGLRRAYNLTKTYVRYWEADAVSLRTLAGVAASAILIVLVVWRMDPVASLVGMCALVPAALWLLPQGRLVIGAAKQPRPVDPEPASTGSPLPADDAGRGAAAPGGADAPDGDPARGAGTAGDPRTGAAASDERGALLDQDARFDDLAARYGLSERERGLLPLLADGLNAQQIADQVFVSRNTAKTHMAHIYQKMGVHARAELDEMLGVRR